MYLAVFAVSYPHELGQQGQVGVGPDVAGDGGEAASAVPQIVDGTAAVDRSRPYRRAVGLRGGGGRGTRGMMTQTVTQTMMTQTMTRTMAQTMMTQTVTQTMMTQTMTAAVDSPRPYRRAVGLRGDRGTRGNDDTNRDTDHDDTDR